MKLTGVVIEGKKRGRALGFPTANIALKSSLEEGIYISQTNVGGKTYNSVTFVGKAETFDETESFAETYILDFDQDIYNQEIEIELLKKIRENMKFDSEQKLIEQIEKDVKEAKIFFEQGEK